jgi:hypothetical protein
MLICCIYAFLHHKESTDMIFGDKPLISDVVLLLFSCNRRHAPACLGLAFILRRDFGNVSVARLYLDFGCVSFVCLCGSAYLMT